MAYFNAYIKQKFETKCKDRIQNTTLPHST